MLKSSLAHYLTTKFAFSIFIRNLPPKKNLKSSLPLRFKARRAGGGGGGDSARRAQPVPFGYFQTDTAMDMEKLRVVLDKKSVKTKVVQILIIGFCLLVFFDYIFYILCRAKICLPWPFL